MRPSRTLASSGSTGQDRFDVLLTFQANILGALQSAQVTSAEALSGIEAKLTTMEGAMGRGATLGQESLHQAMAGLEQQFDEKLSFHVDANLAIEAVAMQLSRLDAHHRPVLVVPAAESSSPGRGCSS